MAAVKVTGAGEVGGGGIVDGSEDLLTRRRHKTKATMQILQKQQFTDDNLRQVTSPSPSPSPRLPSRTRSWAPVVLLLGLLLGSRSDLPAHPLCVCVLC